MFCSKENPQKTLLNGYQMPQKKAVILKNCFVYLKSKNDNSIDGQNTAQKATTGSVQRAFIVGFSSPTKA
jgi:hypothetical protein